VWMDRLLGEERSPWRREVAVEEKSVWVDRLCGREIAVEKRGLRREERSEWKGLTRSFSKIHLDFRSIPTRGGDFAGGS
jgi:hypothetical protein